MVHGFDVINVITITIQKLGYSSLKREQLDIIVEFLNSRDVFAILLTGIGKTLCYACIPLVFHGMDPLCDRPSIVLVITLLAAIMKDDVIAGDFIFRAFNCIPISQLKYAQVTRPIAQPPYYHEPYM